MPFNDQLTDGGPQLTPESPNGCAGPPFGEAPGWHVFASRFALLAASAKAVTGVNAMVTQETQARLAVRRCALSAIDATALR
jgi:hypothetical protein